MKRPGPDDRGNLTQTHRKWVVPKNKQRVGSGVIVGDHFFILDEPGIMQCIELATGDTMWEERSVGRASAIIADGKLIVLGDKGELSIAAPSQAKTLPVSSVINPSITASNRFAAKSGVKSFPSGTLR